MNIIQYDRSFRLQPGYLNSHYFLEARNGTDLYVMYLPLFHEL